jgi:uncharacterized membrane protein YtjA (UPF0391 family)
MARFRAFDFGAACALAETDVWEMVVMTRPGKPLTPDVAAGMGIEQGVTGAISIPIALCPRPGGQAGAAGWNLLQSRKLARGFTARWRARRPEEFGVTLLKWALIFLVISIIAGILGFTGISAASADIARFLFYVFVVIFLVLLILGLTIFRA